MRGHVAAAAGIVVRAPRTAHLVAALEDHEGTDALLLEPDRHAEAGEAGADDRDAEVLAVARLAAHPAQTNRALA